MTSVKIISPQITEQTGAAQWCALTLQCPKLIKSIYSWGLSFNLDII